MFYKKNFQDGMVTFWGANVELKETKYVVVSYWNYKNNSKKLNMLWWATKSPKNDNQLDSVTGIKESYKKSVRNYFWQFIIQNAKKFFQEQVMVW